MKGPANPHSARRAAVHSPTAEMKTDPSDALVDALVALCQQLEAWSTPIGRGQGEGRASCAVAASGAHQALDRQ